MTDSAIKVGMIAEQTGPLSFMGCANANVARMVLDDINANGASPFEWRSPTLTTNRAFNDHFAVIDKNP